MIRLLPLLLSSTLSLPGTAQVAPQYRVPAQNVSLKGSSDSTLNAVAGAAMSTSATTGSGLPEYFVWTNLLGETAPVFAVTSSFVPVSGVTYTRRMIASKSGVVTKLGFRVLVGGVSLSATGSDNAVAVYDSVGTRLTLQSLTSLLTTTGDKVVTLSSPITLVKGKSYYISVLNTATLSVAQWAASPASPIINHGQSSAPYHWGSTATGGLVSLWCHPANLTPAICRFPGLVFSLINVSLNYTRMLQSLKTGLRSLIERIAAQNNIRANIAQLLLLVPAIIAIISKVGMLQPTGLLVWTFIATGLALLGQKLLDTKVFDIGAWLSIIYSLLLYAADSPTVATLWPNATNWLAGCVQVLALVIATFSKQTPVDNPPINLKDK